MSQELPRLDLAVIPALPVALAVIIGSAAALFVPTAGVLPLTLTIVLVTGAVIIARFGGTNRLLSVFFLLFFVSLAWFRADAELNRVARWQIYHLAQDTDSVSVTGRVCVPREARKDANMIVLDRAALQSDAGPIELGALRVRVFADSESLANLAYGDIVLAFGRVRSSSERSARFSGALSGILVRREVCDVFAEPGDVFVTHVGGNYIARLTDRTRFWIQETFDKYLTPDAASLCRALVLGDRQDFGYRFNDQLRLTGLSHIFALSGLNTGLILSLLWVFLGLFFVPKNIRYWILLLAALFYMELGREVPSLVRATLMSSLFLLGRLLQRRAHVLNYVAAALAIELLWRPLDLIDPGFALSYLAVLGMVAGFHVIHHTVTRLIGDDRIGLRRSIVDVAAGTLTAQVGTYPLVAFLFQRIPLLGILGNLIVVPGFAILLILAFLLLLLNGISEGLASLLAPTVEILSITLGWVVTFFADIPLSGLQVPAISMPVLALIYAALILILVELIRKRWARVTIYALSLLTVFAWSGYSQEESKGRITFIDVGNGDAILIESPERMFLIDAGPRYGEWSAARIILPYLMDRGVSEIDGLILTHPDSDHIGGAADLLQRLDVERLWTNGDSAESRSYIELMIAAEQKGLASELLTAGDRLRLDKDMELLVLSPDRASMKRFTAKNRKSLVLLLKTPQTSVLLTADIDSTIEHELMLWGETLNTDLLRIAHHGSKSSSCIPFLRRCAPELAIITAGRRNSYGHPAPEVLDRLDLLEFPYLVTARESTLAFEITKAGWRRVETQAQRLAQLWSLPYG